MILPNIEMRLYALRGCVHCERAMEFLQRTGISYEVILAENDPIIMKAVQFEEDGVRKAMGFPILVSFATQETLVGFEPDAYADVVKRYSNRLSARAADGAGATREHSGETKNVASEQTQTSQGAA